MHAQEVWFDPSSKNIHVSMTKFMYPLTNIVFVKNLLYIFLNLVKLNIQILVKQIFWFSMDIHASVSP